MGGRISSVWREVAGKLGEDLLTHFLAKEGIIAIQAGDSKLPFDLIVPVPDGKIFTKRAVIQVRTESQVRKLSKQYTFLPDKEGYDKILTDLNKLGFSGYKLWFALLWINWEGNKLRFNGCVCPASKIKNSDFRKTQKPSIYFWKIREKSPLKFNSDSSE